MCSCAVKYNRVRSDSINEYEIRHQVTFPKAGIVCIVLAKGMVAKGRWQRFTARQQANHLDERFKRICVITKGKAKVFVESGGLLQLLSFTQLPPVVSRCSAGSLERTHAAGRFVSHGFFQRGGVGRFTWQPPNLSATGQHHQFGHSVMFIIKASDFHHLSDFLPARFDWKYMAHGDTPWISGLSASQFYRRDIALRRIRRR